MGLSTGSHGRVLAVGRLPCGHSPPCGEEASSVEPSGSAAGPGGPLHQISLVAPASCTRWGPRISQAWGPTGPLPRTGEMGQGARPCLHPARRVCPPPAPGWQPWAPGASSRKENSLWGKRRRRRPGREAPPSKPLGLHTEGPEPLAAPQSPRSLAPGLPVSLTALFKVLGPAERGPRPRMSLGLLRLVTPGEPRAAPS